MADYSDAYDGVCEECLVHRPNHNPACSIGKRAAEILARMEEKRTAEREQRERYKNELRTMEPEDLFSKYNSMKKLKDMLTLRTNAAMEVIHERGLQQEYLNHRE